MKAIPKKYPAIWLKSRANKQRIQEQRRQHVVHELDHVLKKLMKRYTWDDAYIFGSLTQTGKYGPGSDVDIALSGLNKFDYYAFVGDISEMLNRRVDVVLLEECHFRKAIMEKGVKWNPKKK